jgi:hypothetical protein
MFEYKKQNDEMVRLEEGNLGYQIPWITKYLNSLFEKTIIVTEKYDTED